MCSSFYGLGGRLLPVGEYDQSEGEPQRGGDLADMVRSSLSGQQHRRPGSDLYSQISNYCTSNNNHHQLWSLTTAAADEELLAEEEENCVDHRLMSSSGECLLDDSKMVEYLHQAVAAVGDPFSSIMMGTDPPDLHHHHEHNNYESMQATTTAQHDIHLPNITKAAAGYLYSSSSCSATSTRSQDPTACGGGSRVIIHDHTSSSSSSTTCVKPPINCNVFSQMLHISSSANDLLPPPPSIVDHNKQQQLPVIVSSSQQGAHHPPIPSASFTLGGDHNRDMMLLNDDYNNRNCTTPSVSCCDGLLHMASPRNPAIKRSRKSLAKKVVCIPAPAPANSRPSGEVVPSDLWAWRKYGQKPIKGSPYPRGYYRCSSSKGCSARKQVERSRTDPNMLVITYTSEHNHPWPTQRNALAGSTRSHPSKSTSSSSLTGVIMDDQLKRRISSSGDERKPAEIVMIKQQKVDDDLVASTQEYPNNQQDNSTRNYEGDEHWRCSYNKTTYRPRTLDHELEGYNDRQPQDDDFFAELGEIAGKDHNAFSNFLMEWPSSSERT